MEEIWKDIKGYEGLYQVSNMGRVKSLGNNKCRKEKILKFGTDGGGYLYVGLSKDGKRKYYKIHRLVLMTFKPIENMDKLEVDHIDTNPSNNNLENLRWCTRKENCNNSLTRLHNSEAQKIAQNRPEVRKKTIENSYMRGKLGIKCPNSIPVVQLTLDGELVEVYGSINEAERSGFNHNSIIRCTKGIYKKHKGYKWEYLHKYLLLKYPRITKLNLFGKQYERGCDN